MENTPRTVFFKVPDAYEQQLMNKTGFSFSSCVNSVPRYRWFCFILNNNKNKIYVESVEWRRDKHWDLEIQLHDWRCCGGNCARVLVWDFWRQRTHSGAVWLWRELLQDSGQWQQCVAVSGEAYYREQTVRSREVRWQQGTSGDIQVPVCFQAAWLASLESAVCVWEF